MSHTDQHPKELQARIKVLEHENAMLVERTEDILLLGLISEAVNAEDNIESMLAIALEKMAILKDIDFLAICRRRDQSLVVENSFNSLSEQDISGRIIHLPGNLRPSPDGLIEISGASSQFFLGADLASLKNVLLIPYAAEAYGSGYLLLAVAAEERRWETCRGLFCRALEILMMNVSNRLLLKNYQEINIALDQELHDQSHALENSEECFRTVIEQAFEAFFLHDSDGKILQINQRACDLLGYTKDELLKLNVSDIIADIPPDQLQSFLSSFSSDNYLQSRAIHKSKDGQLIPVDINVSRVQLGGQYLYLALTKDLSRQIETEQLQKQLDLLLENLPDVVCMASPEGQILYLNRMGKELLKIGDEPNVTHNVAEMMPPHIAQQCQQQRLPEARKSGAWVGESFLIATNEELIPTLQTIVAPQNQRGVVENIFYIDRDLRELRRLEEQFVHAQKMEAVGTLVGGIAHDFNNFLAGIMGNVFLLLRNVEPGPQQERLKSVQQMCQSAAGMVAQLLVFARKDAVSISPLKLSDFIAEFGKMYQVLIPENICFEVGEIDPALIVQTDLAQFQQVIVNLLTNARDALEGCDNPTIGVSVEAYTADEAFLNTHQSLTQKDLVCLSVIDNGCGMPLDIQAKIFEPFFTTKEVNKGTGLGLAMVYGAIARQGGAIQIDSTFGEGTIVRLYLPRVYKDAEKAVSEETAGIVYGQGELLILADDDAYIRESHKDALTQLGYQVLPVADGQQALETFESCPQVAMVISDIVMPNLDGVTAGRMMREINAELPLLYMSGYADLAVNSENLPSGAEILKKPATIEQLSRNVAQLLYPKKG